MHNQEGRSSGSGVQHVDKKPAEPQPPKQEQAKQPPEEKNEKKAEEEKKKPDPAPPEKKQEEKKSPQQKPPASGLWLYRVFAVQTVTMLNMVNGKMNWVGYRITPVVLAVSACSDPAFWDCPLYLRPHLNNTTRSFTFYKHDFV